MRGKSVFIGIVLFCAAAGTGSALDNQGWIGKARETLRSHTTFSAGETPEDGVYCVSLGLVRADSGRNDEERLLKAKLEAQKNLTAYIHGEKVSASRSFTQKGGTAEGEGGGRGKGAFSETFQAKIKADLDAFMRGMRVIGQITERGDSYVVVIVTEQAKDESTVLKAALAEMGGEGVTRAVGEAANYETALQRALRGAVEQILGTLVVGYDKSGTKEGVDNRIFSGTDGTVEKYRVIAVGDIEIGKRVEIVARVSKKKLLDNYSVYMKFLGDPGFLIESDSEDLQARFGQFFTDLGIRVVHDPKDAAYIIDCHGRYRPVFHPADGRRGTQLSLRFKIMRMNGSESLLDMKNRPQSASCFIGTDPERQKEVCAEKAFAQMRDPVHKKVQEIVGRMVSKELDSIARDKK